LGLAAIHLKQEFDDAAFWTALQAWYYCCSFLWLLISLPSIHQDDCTTTTPEFSAVHELNTTMQWLSISTDCLQGWRHF
jgi:hypothetical protein